MLCNKSIFIIISSKIYYYKENLFAQCTCVLVSFNLGLKIIEIWIKTTLPWTSLFF